MLPDIPYMYDCWMDSQEEDDRDVWSLIDFDKYVVRVVKKLGRKLSQAETDRLEKAFFAKSQDDTPFHARMGLYYVMSSTHGEWADIPF